VFSHHEQKIRGIDLLLLLYLANHANGDDGSGAWPSQGTLADETGVARRTVQHALARLVDGGAVEIEQRPGRTHRFRVRMCAVCLPSPSAHQVRSGTNLPAQEMRTRGAPDAQGCAPDAHEPFIQPVSQPPNEVSASPPTKAAAPARPTGSDEFSASNRKGDPTPPESGRAEFIARRVEKIRQEQGDRAAAAYLAKVAQNAATDERRAEMQRLHSGETPEGYAGFVPAKYQEQWRALHPDTGLAEGTES
jgi:hypothetical protein